MSLSRVLAVSDSMSSQSDGLPVRHLIGHRNLNARGSRVEILAIICARNELPYLRHVLPYLADEKIEVALIDNGSIDGTSEVVASGEFNNVVRYERLPYNGVFDLAAQLQFKSRLTLESTADWLIHQDADEFLTSRGGWGGLRDQIEKCDMAGFNVINFNELVMMPEDPTIDAILSNNKLFYFFEPRPRRLMRAWKRSARLNHGVSGGHTLHGNDIRVSPHEMLLKHFIVRSQAHALEKYLNRSFAPTDLSYGWHENRRNFTKDNLTLPGRNQGLLRLSSPMHAPSTLPSPVTRHFWEW